MKVFYVDMEDDENFEEDIREFSEYFGKPFTGVIEERWKNGVLVAQVATYQGTWKGYLLFCSKETGKPELLQYRGGVTIAWNEHGILTSADKVWGGQVCEKGIIENGKLIDSKIVMDDETQELKRECAFGTRSPCREEPLFEQFEEAMERLRTGTLFTQDWLYLPEDYYTRDDEK
jgi:hypothetical protein